MRFTSSLEKPKVLLKLFQSLGKIKGDCILVLSPTKSKIVLQGDIQDAVQVWVDFTTSSFFDNAVVESKNDNFIGMQLQISHLKQALQSIVSMGGEGSLRLKKRDGTGLPLLSVSILQPPKQQTITQDIPVVMLTATQVSELREPELPDGGADQISFFMPPLNLVLNVIEKMKNLSQELIVSAQTNHAQLQLSVDTNYGNIKTFFKVSFPAIADRPINTDQAATVKVDIKKFSKAMGLHQIKAKHVVTTIVQNRYINLLIIVDKDFSITYYIPLIY